MCVYVLNGYLSPVMSGKSIYMALSYLPDMKMTSKKSASTDIIRAHTSSLTYQGLSVLILTCDTGSPSPWHALC